MPEMDGWEAAYIIRKVYQSNTPIAIVSANAFDKALDNTADIASSDFIVKPVNIEDLLNWLGQKLSIEWKWAFATEHTVSPTELDAEARLKLQMPPYQHLHELLEMIDLGYIKGITEKLDKIALMDKKYSSFATLMRQFLTQFDVEEMKKLINHRRHQ